MGGLQSTMNTTTGTSSLNEPPVSPQINAMQEEIASLKEQNEKLTKENIKRQDAVSKLNALQRTLDFTQKELREVSAVRKSLKESRELCVKLDEDKKKLKKELNSLKRKNEKLVTEMQAILLNTEEYLKRKKENSLSN